MNSTERISGTIMQMRNATIAMALLWMLAGASTALSDRGGRTPLALARERGHAEMVRMLQAAGAR